MISEKAESSIALRSDAEKLFDEAIIILIKQAQSLICWVLNNSFLINSKNIRIIYAFYEWIKKIIE